MAGIVESGLGIPHDVELLVMGAGDPRGTAGGPVEPQEALDGQEVSGVGEGVSGKVNRWEATGSISSQLPMQRLPHDRSRLIFDNLTFRSPRSSFAALDDKCDGPWLKPKWSAPGLGEPVLSGMDHS